ncbi:MAG TPA: transketolase [Thermomicrobiales bacterium]|nr:transketolase [Thermomicrobiales bacterium]
MVVASPPALETLAINTIRTLSIDAVQKANSGHPGLPLGAAPMAYVLWTEYLKHNPNDPRWPDRDRFVLSAGHGSMLLYSLLHLTGYDLPLEEIKRFRQLGSKTPGHPERGHTPGVEVTTGPLGQGFANGVGMAMAEAFLAAHYNRSDHEIVDHYTYGIVSDGDLMEGVTFEAAALAGHLKLAKLIYLYDQNHISLAGTTGLAFSEDVGARFDALGWQTLRIDGQDTEAVREALDQARAETERPTLILARTTIGYGSPKANTFGVHGSPLGPEAVAKTKENLDWPAEPAFYIPEDALSKFREALDRGAEAQAQWRMRFDAYAEAYPELAASFTRAMEGTLPNGWDVDLPHFALGDKPMASRKASGETIARFAPKIPYFIGGSADLNPSTNTAMKGEGDFEAPSRTPGDEQGTTGGGWGYEGRNIHFGVREHAMGSAVNGMAAHGGVIPFGATFLVFSDYMRPAIRLAALSQYKSIFVFTHDSIAVGEDGPTHEPVEHVMSLRAIPKLTVVRPADPNETVEAWRMALTNGGPTALILSRQDLTVLDRSEAQGGVQQGGYVLAGADGKPDIVLIGTGSEVELCVMARGILEDHGINARVVSLPSWELFEKQDKDYQADVLGPEGTPRLSVEAGVTLGWCRYTGPRGGSVGVDTYGASGPGSDVLAHYGLTKEHVAAEALRLLGRDDLADQVEPPRDTGETAGEEAEGGEGHS